MSVARSQEAVDPEQAVHDRYSAAAVEQEPELCCPVAYDRRLLEAIPAEVLERDYGCGDPSPYVRSGDSVLDLGAGGGKLCFLISQLVGPEGEVIGVDCNCEMLALAERNRPIVAKNVGFSNVEFRYGRIQDLRLDLARLDRELAAAPVASADDWLRLGTIEERLRKEVPLVENDSVDCIVSNCVLNLVRTSDRVRLFGEMFRVLRTGGRVAISDIVADEDVPESLRTDGRLWSGCLAGAFREDRFLEAFERAGFHGIEIARREPEPWRVVAGIAFRSMTVTAHKGKQGPCLERRQALVYRGPFLEVRDDDDHVFVRGERAAVCDKTFRLLTREPYREAFLSVEPTVPVRLDEASSFDCRHGRVRRPDETKAGSAPSDFAGPDGCCGGESKCC